MSNIRLNLARKWRAKGFNHIIGQDLTVRILKNSLYLGNYFPVYLLWGGRGSGKTSTARVFAAAINCQQLDDFRDNPKTSSVPCLQCESCKAMLAGKHPDFIEMDAASHTGVDNVRQVIDAASLMPLLGKKKIYLIDEAHMLSKAAFNAFLKILEEPPASVLFILATTDPEKIIDTVKSRCFQLFFKPVASEPLHNHLSFLCREEDIEFEPEALDLLVKEAGGSVRDAINLLEQVRFASESVTRLSVIQALGHIDDERLLNLFNILLHQGTVQLLPFLQEIKIRLFSAEHLWIRLMSLIRASIWLKHGLDPEPYHQWADHLRSLIQQDSLKKLTKLLERFYKQEPLFLRTTDKHLFLEILLLQACQRNDTTGNSNTSQAAPLPPPAQQSEDDEDEYEFIEEEEEIEEDDDDSEEASKLKPQKEIEKINDHGWNDFVAQIAALEDPLLNSIFKQAIFSRFDSNTVTVEFNKEFIFFNEWLENSHNLWHPLLQKVFGQAALLNPLFTLKGSKVSQPATSGDTYSTTKEKTSKCPPKSVGNVASPIKKYAVSTNRISGNNGPKMGKIVDVSDEQNWKKAHLLLRHFPGVVSEAV